MWQVLALAFLAGTGAFLLATHFSSSQKAAAIAPPALDTAVDSEVADAIAADPVATPSTDPPDTQPAAIKNVATQDSDTDKDKDTATGTDISDPDTATEDTGDLQMDPETVTEPT